MAGWQHVAAGCPGLKTGEGFRAWTPEQMNALRCRLAVHLQTARENLP
jgi:hypothetical protein